MFKISSFDSILRYLFAISLLSYCGNTVAQAMEHAVIFEDPSAVVKRYPVLKKVSHNFIPIREDAAISETDFESKLTSVIVENEYSISPDSGVSTIGIYDCIALALPDVGLLMHVHMSSSLRSVQDILRIYKNEKISLYTASLSPFINKMVETLSEIGFPYESMSLFLQPMELIEIGNDFDPMKYKFSYEGVCNPGSYAPQQIIFYVDENGKQVVIEEYNKAIKGNSRDFFRPFVDFASNLRKPLHIYLENKKVNFLEIDNIFMRKLQDSLYDQRDSLSNKERLVKI